MCGEARPPSVRSSLCAGPSPRVRGSPGYRAVRDGRAGSIPACAGKPCAGHCVLALHQVHPRVCGEAFILTLRQLYYQGPSPRVRGSQERTRGVRVGSGSIPACAGKPRALASTAGGARVHPRVCGEAMKMCSRPGRHLGPSPRVRGSLYKWRERDCLLRSIPACAGKPRGGPAERGAVRVHPRVCGEAYFSTFGARSSAGPSPRVRGSPDLEGGDPDGVRSIPACAGKPYTHHATRIISRVHPRVCGEASVQVRRASCRRGPSPRVRGSHAVNENVEPPHGSIPACAGKPGGWSVIGRAPGVHPRVCGEALKLGRLQTVMRGPSPRVRGSRRLGQCVSRPRGVHPRVCGEARFKGSPPK